MITTPAPSTSPRRRLEHGAAAVRTQIGQRRLRRRQLAAVGEAFRAFRAADRLLPAPRLTGLKGDS